VNTTVLITGGAGFIGCHLTEALLQRGYRVRVLDSLIDQVRGERDHPARLSPDAEFILGDVRDEAIIKHCLKGIDRVVHLAAEIGVGQSMYAVDRYVSVNDHGTAILFQQLIGQPVERVVVASSMSIYGEGLYCDADGVVHEDVVRMPRTGIGKIGRHLGFAVRRNFEYDLAELADWVAAQQADDHVLKASRELETRGLVA